MRLRRVVGVLLVAIGLSANQWTLERFVVGDGVLGSTTALLLAAIEIVMVAAGLLLRRVPARSRRRSGSRAGLVLVSLAMLLVVVEVAARLWHGAPAAESQAAIERAKLPRAYLEKAAPTGWRLVPNRQFQWTVENVTSSYASNAQGFRGPRDFSEPTPFRVALTGDSLTLGPGVDYEQTFGALVEQRLRAGRVDNFGMPGFGIDQMWLSVRDQILPLAPAFVIVAFTDNDFARTLTPYRVGDDLDRPRLVLEHGKIRALTPADAPSGVVAWLSDHSAAWRLFTDVTTALRPFGEWWTLNTALFDAIAADCGRLGVPVLFVRLPQRDAGSFPSLARHMRERGFEYIDLGPDGASEDLLYKDDPHMTARGHARVAAAAGRWLTQHHPDWVRAR